MKMKSKLMAVSLMLVVSILMMSTASFAWFTISTAPEITDMKAQVVVNENLEIALATSADKVANAKMPTAPAVGDTGIQTKWGNVVDLDSTTDTTTTNAYGTTLNKTLRPATLAGTTPSFQYPTYGTDGRVNALAALSEDEAIQFGNIYSGSGADKEVYGYYVDVWVRTNMVGENIDITFSDVGLANSSADTTIGGGSYFTSANKKLADNLGVAVKIIATGDTAYDGTQTVAAYTSDTIRAMTMGDVAEAEGKYTTKITGTIVDNAVANKAYLVRIYVYLEGTNVWNDTASIFTDAANTAASLVQGDLNLQMKATNVDKSMDGEA